MVNTTVNAVTKPNRHGWRALLSAVVVVGTLSAAVAQTFQPARYADVPSKRSAPKQPAADVKPKETPAPRSG